MNRFKLLFIALLFSTVFIGCPSAKRLTIEGYDDAVLNAKRVFVLLPASADIRLTNAELYATSRGIDATSAGETIEGELRTVLVGAIQSRLDSNTVLNYFEQPVSGIVPLNATTDFNGAAPVTWSTVKRAGVEGNIDYLLVLRDVVVTSTPSSDPRGNEAVSASYSLLDIAAERVMTSGTIAVSISAPRTTASTHEGLAAELTAKLPFTVVE